MSVDNVKYKSKKWWREKLLKPAKKRKEVYICYRRTKQKYAANEQNFKLKRVGKPIKRWVITKPNRVNTKKVDDYVDQKRTVPKKEKKVFQGFDVEP